MIAPFILMLLGSRVTSTPENNNSIMAAAYRVPSVGHRVHMDSMSKASLEMLSKRFSVANSVPLVTKTHGHRCHDAITKLIINLQTGDTCCQVQL